MKTSASATFIHGAPFIDINIANRVYGSEDWNKKTRTAKRLSLDQWDAVQHPRRQDLRGCLPPTRAYCRGQHSFDRTSLKIWWLRDRIFFLNSSNMSVSSLCLDSGRSGVSRLSVSQPTDPRSTVHGHIIHIKFQGLQYLALIPLRSLATAPPPPPPQPPQKKERKKRPRKKKEFLATPLPPNLTVLPLNSFDLSTSMATRWLDAGIQGVFTNRETPCQYLNQPLGGTRTGGWVCLDD